jgi:hypothetical protein
VYSFPWLAHQSVLPSLQNDSGEKLSILAGTLARLDREAPYYGGGIEYRCVGLVLWFIDFEVNAPFVCGMPTGSDWNTFYYGAASRYGERFVESLCATKNRDVRFFSARVAARRDLQLLTFKAMRLL